MRDIPVFIINGFLDSGKTSFIIETIAQDEFYKKGRTLIIMCEDGEIEYDPEFLQNYNVELLKFEDQLEYSLRKVNDVIRKNDIRRVIVEMNDMWDFDAIDFPSYCQVMQEALFVNFETFGIYFNNMRQKFVELIKQADLVVFNRCDDIDELRKYQTNIKMINNQARYVAMNTSGQIQEAFLRELPYDINADIIEIQDDDYGIWYMDTFDNKDNYINKVVCFNCLVVLSDQLPKGTFIAGRLAMTCCADDVQLFGHLCNDMLNLDLKDREWIRLTATITYEYSEEYEEEEAILTPLKIERIKEIKTPILNFS